MATQAGRFRIPAQRRLAFAIGCIASTGFAQGVATPTDALILQQQRERAQQEQYQRPAPDIRLPRVGSTAAEDTEPPRSPGGPCFPIHRIHIRQTDGPHTDDAITRAYEGRCLATTDVNRLMSALQDDLIARGYVTTRVLAEPQDLQNGVLTLTVLPGRVRDFVIEEPEPARGALWNTLPMASGEVLDLRDIEQGLENLKRVPTADADIQIAPAAAEDAAPGQSDLHIRYQQAFPFRLSVFADDGGAKATGRYQGGATLSFDNPLTLSDLLYVTFSRDLENRQPRGTRNLAGHYSVPFGYWLLSLNGSQYRYRQAVAGANETYVYGGTSDSADVRLSRVMYRDASRKTQAYLRGYLRSTRNTIDDTEIEVQRRRVAGYEIGISHREFIDQAILDATLAYRRGTGAMHALPAPEEAFGEGDSRAGIVTADLQLTLPFQVSSTRWRYTGSLRAQWTNKPLTPQDRFAIGGRYTVRGFDGELSLSAERGFLVRNDFGLALGASGQELYLGVDYGQVNGPSDVFLLGRRLAGAVLGLRGSIRGVQYDLFAGTPLKKPDGFRTASVVYGFSLNYQF